MGFQDRDYVKNRGTSDDKAAEDYERSVRESNYGKDGGPGMAVKVIAAILVVLLFAVYAGSC